MRQVYIARVFDGNRFEPLCNIGLRIISAKVIVAGQAYSQAVRCIAYIYGLLHYLDLRVRWNINTHCKPAIGLLIDGRLAEHYIARVPLAVTVRVYIGFHSLTVAAVKDLVVRTITFRDIGRLETRHLNGHKYSIRPHCRIIISKRCRRRRTCQVYRWNACLCRSWIIAIGCLDKGLTITGYIRIIRRADAHLPGELYAVA